MTKLQVGTRVRALANVFETKAPGSDDDVVPAGTEGIIIETIGFGTSYPYDVLWDGLKAATHNNAYPMREDEIEAVS